MGDGERGPETADLVRVRGGYGRRGGMEEGLTGSGNELMWVLIGRTPGGGREGERERESSHVEMPPRRSSVHAYEHTVGRS